MPTSAKEFAEYSDDSFASNISEDELRVRQSPSKVNQKKKKKVSKTGRVKKPASPYGHPMKATGPKKTSEEMWIDGIHKGTGLTASVKSSNYLGLTGKKAHHGSSCSDYLRETVLGMPSRRSQSAMDDTFARSTKGVPVYKPQEDMYDDILDLRKSVTGLKQENELIKARNRRLEDDNNKKEKQIDELMMGSRIGDMRMTSTGKLVDPSAKITILKQKNVKLEMAVKEKENALKKLNEDMKCTNIDEMKIAMETFYQEVQRLRIEQSENEKLSRSMKQSSNSNSKLKALNATVLRLTEANQRVQSENKLLKLDLQRAMEKSPRTGAKGNRDSDYKDMDRHNLLANISKLESELEEVKGRELKNSVSEANKKQLLDTIDRQEKDIKRLKEDKSKLKKTIDEQEQEIKELHGKLKKLSAQILREAEEAGKSKLVRHSSSESLHHNTPRSRSGSSASLKRKQKEDESRHEEQKRKAHELRKTNSAKSIQRNWRAHKKLKEEEEMDAATVTIQSAFRGHESRKKYLQQMNRRTPSPVNRYEDDSDSDEEEEEDSDMEDVATTIQSAARGHWGRQKQLNNYSARNSEMSDAESVSSKRSVRSNKSNASKKQDKSKKQIARDYLEDSDDSDALVTSKTKASPRLSNNGKTPNKSVKKGNPYGGALDDSDDDSDDELVIAAPRRRSYQFGR